MMLACLAISAISVSSFAQNLKQPNAGAASATAAGSATAAPKELTAQQMGENRAKALRIQYKLTEEQYQKSLAIENEYAVRERQMRGVRSRPGESPMVNMMMEKDQRYKNVMTPKQFDSYSATRPKPMQPAAPLPASSNSSVH